ncbi:MAG TPA: hypothetical protein VNG33_17555, partial [Polyangiaceae bacterium]|nr:hypothetical protein [Polyangiaceae bacterium]
VPLVPLVSGHESVFAFAPIDPNQPMMNTCAMPMAKVEQPTTLEGHAGVLYETPCGESPYLIEGSGDQLTVYLVANGALTMTYEYIHSPVAEGETWLLNGMVQTWHRVPAPLVTAAGSFDDCWRRSQTDFSLDYCRGAGLVRMRDDTSNYVLDLVSKNF